MNQPSVVAEATEQRAAAEAAAANPQIIHIARKKRSDRWAVHGLQLLLLVVLLLGWQFLTGPAGTGKPLDEIYVGRPSEAWQSLVDWAKDGTLYHNSIITFRETVFGFILGCALGVIVGFLLGISRLAGRVLSPFILALNTIPKLALAPLLMLWFGLGEESKIALAALLVFFLVFMNTFAGVRDVDGDLIDIMRVMGASKMTIHWRVTLPSAMVWVIAGLKVSVPYAFLGAVVGEMLAAQYGLGALIQRASSDFNPSAMVAAIVVLVVMAAVLNIFVSALDRLLLRWKNPNA